MLDEYESPEVQLDRYRDESNSPRRFMSAPKLVSPSKSGIHNQKQCILLNKVRPFNKIYAMTDSQVKDRHNVIKLADEEYNKPDDSLKRSVSTRIRSANQSQIKARHLYSDLQQRKVMTLSRVAGDHARASLFQNLNSKTFQVPTVNQFIQELERQRKSLLQEIASYRRKITEESKKRAKLNTACKKHMNSIELHNDLRFNNDVELQRALILINEGNDDCNKLQQQLDNLHRRIAQTKKCIDEDKAEIEQYRAYNANAKHNIIHEDKKLNEVKAALTRQLKIMDSHKAQIKINEGEKAKVLLYIRDMEKVHRIKEK